MEHLENLRQRTLVLTNVLLTSRNISSSLDKCWSIMWPNNVLLLIV